MYIQVEYDLNYAGGNYSSVGQFAYIPKELADETGVEEAFRQTTGHDPVHIIHYSEDELYTADGIRLEE